MINSEMLFETLLPASLQNLSQFLKSSAEGTTF